MTPEGKEVISAMRRLCRQRSDWLYREEWRQIREERVTAPDRWEQQRRAARARIDAGSSHHLGSGGWGSFDEDFQGTTSRAASRLERSLGAQHGLAWVIELLDRRGGESPYTEPLTRAELPDPPQLSLPRLASIFTLTPRSRRHSLSALLFAATSAYTCYCLYYLQQVVTTPQKGVPTSLNSHTTMGKFSMEKMEARQTYGNVWHTDLMGTMSADCSYFCFALWCSPCASYLLRKRALYEDMSRYVCCAGYMPCSGSCGESKCPEFCLCTEVWCCFANSVQSTRFLLQDEFNIQTTKCDNCIIGFMFCLQQIACIFSIVAAIVGGGELNEAADLLSCLANAVYCSVCACMQTQHKVELDKRDGKFGPMQAPPSQQMSRFDQAIPPAVGYTPGYAAPPVYGQPAYGQPYPPPGYYPQAYPQQPYPPRY
ncbi:hypothetical protein L7F22_056600 [Adiantum nelumboides]|nr:hypothetical protein [Adiantum nelumboides]